MSTVEEVAGEQSVRLGAQERSPVGVDVPRGRSALAGGQDPPHGRFADAVSEPAQFTVDSAVLPSPWTLRYSHAGFSRASRSTRSRIFGLACGRPGRLGYVHLRLVTAFTRRLANPLAMRLNARGVATLTLVGHRTGETRKVPVIPVQVGGSRHLVPPYGGSDWVRNLRASGKGERSRKGRTEAFHAVEVPVDQRGPVIAGIAKPPVASRAPVFAKLPDARDHPVSRIDSNPGR